MDLTSLLGSLASVDSVQSIAQSVGASEGEVQSVITSALPSLLSGAKAQADNADTLESFANALSQHSKADTSDIASFMGKVDVEDGAKILGHLLGSDKEAVTRAASERSALGSNKTALILAMLAPLLLSKLGQQTQASSAGAGASMIPGLMSGLLGGGSSAGGAAGLLSGLLGGGGSVKPQQAQQPQTVSLTQEQYQALLAQLQAQQAQQAAPSINLGQSQQQVFQEEQQSSGGGLLSGLMNLLK